MPRKGNVITKGLLESLQNRDPKMFDIIRTIDTRLGDIENLESLDIINIISKNILPRSYTPVLTAVTTNPTLNNGTLVGAYVQIGPLVYVEVVYTYGSTSVAGNGVYSFQLPIQALSLQGMLPATVYIAGTGTYNATAIFTSTSLVDILIEEGDAYASHNFPAAWTATSWIKFSGIYLAKSPS